MNLVVAIAQMDILEKKRFNLFTEMGGGFSTSPPNTFWDQHATTTSINYPIVSLGLLYHKSVKWTGLASLSYLPTLIKQRLFFDGLVSTEDIRLKHVSQNVKLNFLLFRSIFLDTRSGLKFGLGFSPQYSLLATVRSNQVKINDGIQDFYGRIIAVPSQQISFSINVSLMYLYDFKRSQIGFKFNLSLYRNSLTDYYFDVENWFIYPGKYSTTGPYLECGFIYAF